MADIQTVVSGDRWRQRAGSRRRAPALPDQRALPQDYRDSFQVQRKLPILTAGPADSSWRRDDGRRDGQSPNDPKRGSAPVRLGVHQCPRCDLLTAVRAIRERIRDKVSLPPAYAIGCSGQFKYLGSAAGCAVMQRIAAPMIGGMVTAPLLSLL
ncbi:hypothetical protein [Massilia varians]|uniref:hypothetical protein n=1 Tax=Massilia TaxID=149698 RepID=UPI0025525DF3|nr:hypothetical protein [Massilia varians]MDK6076292.1 hypothetical protein [Massilia varians]